MYTAFYEQFKSTHPAPKPPQGPAPLTPMPPSVARTLLLFLLLSTLCLPPDMRATETGDETESGTTATTPSPPVAEGAEPLVDGRPDGQEEPLQTLRHRYRQDPTGVRARLGMCRRGQGGPGGGHQHRHRGGEQWSNP